MLRRRRVTDLIEAAVAHRVTLVSGPAGRREDGGLRGLGGARPAAAAPPGQTAWLTVDAEDRDPVRFWQYVLAALVRARAVGPDEAAQLADGAAGGLPARAS